MVGVVQSDHLAEMWCVLLSLQIFSQVFLGVDNLNVVRALGTLLGGSSPHRALELVVDWDFLSFNQVCHYSTELDTVRSVQVKGHATYFLVQQGFYWVC